ncbi:unnamed protein product, partial [Acanthoscelides obtectus]
RGSLKIGQPGRFVYPVQRVRDTGHLEEYRVEEELLNRVDENPSTSTRDVARESVANVQPDDFPARVRFCEWLLHQHDNNPDFLKCILVTDESTFTRNGVNWRVSTFSFIYFFYMVGPRFTTHYLCYFKGSCF